MCAAAELTGDIAHRHDPDDIAILLIKQCCRIAFLRFLDRKLFSDDRTACRDITVHQRFYRHQLFFADLLKMREVKAQIFRTVV